MRQLMQRWFLGPSGSFRNGARTWIYLGFVGIFLVIIGFLSILSPNG